MRFCLSIALLFCAGPALAQSSPYRYEITKYITPAKCAVVSAHPLASEAGVQVLRQGGNAVDAAIATQLALAVVYPEAGNIGGGGFLVARLRGGKTIAIDYREMAPQKASRDMYLDANGAVQTEKSLAGHLAAGVPGTVAGLFASHKHAKLPFARLIAPAIQLAAEGYVITAAEAAGLNRRKDDFIRINTKPTAFVKETPWKAGDTLVQKDLARTLELIAQKGAAGFYQGETAEKVVAEMRRGGGIISAADLKNYRAKVRTPLQFKFRGYDVISMPLPSSGGIGIRQMLGMVEPYPLEQWGFHSTRSVQVMIEAERRAYADRAQHLGDVDFVSVPIASLTHPAYLKKRMQTFTPGQATPSEKIKAGQFPESMQTTHLSVFDAEGNAVSVTTTLNGGYGSRVVVGGAGFLLNNEMDDFSVKPGSPNMYGLIGAEANAIRPGKRMLSSMTPTIVVKNNKPVLITGTPGGSTIITSVFQTILNALVFDLDAKTTVFAPKFHHQWLPDEVRIEKDFPDSTRMALEKMGYKMVVGTPWSRTELIKIHPDGKIEAVGDKRGDDSAAGY
ncbi:gamma-glutamyltransferase [Chitinophaga lutea]|uniref:Glutathione hydrolase proenzyme n=1 Tax=Chitinophaga lutea TaxID=2488634 RepID=A0A3N4PMB5_9BACT|nr:gamma-glutamyltransferase [Chitinophaga lutea]RPE06041.1 gamma-glutamyltransferase [Chitinophaga lutea]